MCPDGAVFPIPGSASRATSSPPPGPLALIATPVFAVVNIDYVTVGNAGNSADASGYGAVAYEYNIARNETTVAQYAEFLNATAANDSYGLYDTSMASSTYSGSLDHTQWQLRQLHLQRGIRT